MSRSRFYHSWKDCFEHSGIEDWPNATLSANALVAEVCTWLSNLPARPNRRWQPEVYRSRLLALQETVWSGDTPAQVGVPAILRLVGEIAEHEHTEPNPVT